MALDGAAQDVVRKGAENREQTVPGVRYVGGRTVRNELAAGLFIDDHSADGPEPPDVRPMDCGWPPALPPQLSRRAARPARRKRHGC